MAKRSKKLRRWILAGIGVLAVLFFGWRWWQGKKNAIPKSIAWGNGRIEAQLVDASAKEPLRVKEVLVDEGDLVKKGQVLVRLDTVTLEATLAEAKATTAGAEQNLSVTQASISKKKSEIALAKIEEERSRKLAQERAGSEREHDVRAMTVKTTSAGLAEEEAKLDVAAEQLRAAQASEAQIQTRIDDATLVSPVLGRVLYRLAEPGEVLGPGGKALTLVNLEDVYMEIFLPAKQAAAVQIGAEARFKVDYQPDRVGVGFVSFVSPEAQFTPKEVETASEREKLMFRVKIQVPPELVQQYIERVKTGVRGVGYIKLDPNASWPKFLDKNLIRPEAPSKPPLSREP